MKTNQIFSFLLLSFFMFFILFGLKEVYAQERSGIGISPSCFPNDDADCKTYYEFTQTFYNVDEVFTTEFRVYNFDNKTREFFIDIKAVDCSFNKKGLDKIKTLSSPDYFILDQHNTGDCNSSQGCQEIKLMIPSTAIKQGKCTLNLLIISPDEVNNTMLKVNQIIGVKISINKKESWIYKYKILIIVLFILLITSIILFWQYINKFNKQRNKDIKNKEHINKNQEYIKNKKAKDEKNKNK